MADILSALRDAHRKVETFRKQNNTQQYPEDFKRLALDAYFKGISVNKMRTVIGVSRKTIYAWIQQNQQPSSEQLIPVERVKEHSMQPPTILLLPHGVKIEIPLSILEDLLGRILKAS